MTAGRRSFRVLPLGAAARPIDACKSAKCACGASGACDSIGDRSLFRNLSSAFLRPRRKPVLTRRGGTGSGPSSGTPEVGVVGFHHARTPWALRSTTQATVSTPTEAGSWPPEAPAGPERSGGLDASHILPTTLTHYPQFTILGILHGQAILVQRSVRHGREVWLCERD